LYLQPDNFATVAPPLINASSIVNFNLTTFAHGAGLGSPIAGDYFLASNTSAESGSSSKKGGASIGYRAMPIVTILMSITVFAVLFL
jgi:hypothetical protein